MVEESKQFCLDGFLMRSPLQSLQTLRVLVNLVRVYSFLIPIMFANCFLNIGVFYKLVYAPNMSYCAEH